MIEVAVKTRQFGIELQADCPFAREVWKPDTTKHKEICPTITAAFRRVATNCRIRENNKEKQVLCIPTNADYCAIINGVLVKKEKN